MTQTGETVTYSLESVLTRSESKIDTLQRDVDQKIDYFQRDVDQKFGTFQKDVNDLKVETAVIKGEIKTLARKVEGMDKRLEKVEEDFFHILHELLHACFWISLQGFKELTEFFFDLFH